MAANTYTINSSTVPLLRLGFLGLGRVEQIKEDKIVRQGMGLLLLPVDKLALLSDEADHARTACPRMVLRCRDESSREMQKRNDLRAGSIARIGIAA